MAGKNFDFDGKTLTIVDPVDLSFADLFLEKTYSWIFNNISPGDYAPQIDVDKLHSGELGFDIVACANQNGVKVSEPSTKATNAQRAKTQRCLRDFLESYPQLAGFFRNTITSATIAIKNAEFLFGEPCNGGNFIHLKKIVDVINRQSWARDLDSSERQSGVSVLGAISETLLKTVMEGLIDDKAFFRIGNAKVQSYGDFVVVCLPNNLWISVKSNFARERLLASGYSNDILGAGFFEDSSEFTQPVRVRNFQRAGFLAMYCPDIAVTTKQISDNTSTYHEIEQFHASHGSPMPLNINGKPFIRKLSDLPKDIEKLLSEKDIRRRFTVDY